MQLQREHPCSHNQGQEIECCQPPRGFRVPPVHHCHQPALQTSPLLMGLGCANLAKLELDFLGSLRYIRIPQDFSSPLPCLFLLYDLEGRSERAENNDFLKAVTEVVADKCRDPCGSRLVLFPQPAEPTATRHTTRRPAADADVAALQPSVGFSPSPVPVPQLVCLFSGSPGKL